LEKKVVTDEQKKIMRALVELVENYRGKFRTNGLVEVGSVLIHVKDESLRTQAFDAIQCFCECAVSLSFSREELEPILRIAKSKNKRVREIGIQLLLGLDNYGVAAPDAFYQLVHSPRRDIRLSTIAYFQATQPKFSVDFVLHVIASGLEDELPRVRELASSAVHTYGINHDYRKWIRERAVPILIERLKVENDTDVVRTLLFTILRIGDGFEVRKESRNRVCLFDLKVGKSDEGACICELELPDDYVNMVVADNKPWKPRRVVQSSV
jgi:hypothetical protein